MRLGALALLAAAGSLPAASPAAQTANQAEPVSAAEAWTAPVDPASPDAPARCAAAAYMMAALLAEAPPERRAEAERTRDAFMLAAVDADAGRVIDAPLSEMPAHVAAAIGADGARYLATLESRGGEDGDFGRFLLDDMDLCIEYLAALTETLAARRPTPARP